MNIYRYRKKKLHLTALYEFVTLNISVLINLRLKEDFCYLFKSRAKVFSMWIVKGITLKRKKFT